MFGLRSAATPERAIWATLLALALALRLLGSTGYMPGVEQGHLTIIACPDADPNAPLAVGASHHHGKARHNHNACPYAAASLLGAFGTDIIPLFAVLLLGMALLLGRAFQFVERNTIGERPPLRGPPLPA
jgi:hypothetical protein